MLPSACNIDNIIRRRQNAVSTREWEVFMRGNIAAFLAVAVLSPLAWAKTKPELSHVRIVRLSLVQGPAQVRVPGNTRWHRALFNAPVTQGETIRTGVNGRAEIELEDGSALRLIPNSEISFTELARLGKMPLTTARLSRGTVFLNFRKKKTAHGFHLLTPAGMVTAPFGKTDFRVALRTDSAQMRVLKGKAEVTANGLPYQLKKNRQLTLIADAPAELTRNRQRGPWDAWNHQRNQYITMENYRGRTHSPYDMGLAEMSQYGNWMGGCWQPDFGMGMLSGFTASSWSPYMDGQWYFDPILGDTWVSSYPWGWLPYHFGSWMDSGNGWCWMPGAENLMNMDNYQSLATATGPSGVVLHRPIIPPHPPVLHRLIAATPQVAHTGRPVLARRFYRVSHIYNRAEVARLVPAQRAAWRLAHHTQQYWQTRAMNATWVAREMGMPIRWQGPTGRMVSDGYGHMAELQVHAGPGAGGTIHPVWRPVGPSGRIMSGAAGRVGYAPTANVGFRPVISQAPVMNMPSPGPMSSPAMAGSPGPGPAVMARSVGPAPAVRGH